MEWVFDGVTKRFKQVIRDPGTHVVWNPIHGGFDITVNKDDE